MTPREWVAGAGKSGAGCWHVQTSPREALPMPGRLDRKFSDKQRLYLRRALQGYPLYFGLQVTTSTSGKFLLSTRRSEVSARDIRNLQLYEGRGADRLNKLSATPRLGVATGLKDTLILHFRNGKVPACTEAFVTYYVNRIVGYRVMKRVVTAESTELPVVPEELEAARLQATEPVRRQAIMLMRRIEELTISGQKLHEQIGTALTFPPRQVDDALQILNIIDRALDGWQRADELEHRLQQIAARPGVSTEIVQRIHQRYLQVARSQIESGTLDIAFNNLDVAEELMQPLSRRSG